MTHNRLSSGFYTSPVTNHADRVSDNADSFYFFLLGKTTKAKFFFPAKQYDLIASNIQSFTLSAGIQKYLLAPIIYFAIKVDKSWILSSPPHKESFYRYEIIHINTVVYGQVTAHLQ
jgi:hypothetical protein